MALGTPTRKEIGRRIWWLRRTAGLTGEGLAERLSSKDSGIVSKLERGNSLVIERVIEAAEGLAGQGPLTEDEQALFNFMIWGGDTHRVIRSTLTLPDEAPARVLPKRARRASSSQISYLRCIRAPKTATEIDPPRAA